MSKRNFIESPEWQVIVGHIQRAIVGAQEELLTASDILRVKEIAGSVIAMKSFLTLPDTVLKDESDKLLNERTDVLTLTPPRRTPTKVF